MSESWDRRTETLRYWARAARGNKRPIEASLFEEAANEIDALRKQTSPAKECEHVNWHIDEGDVLGWARCDDCGKAIRITVAFENLRKRMTAVLHAALNPADRY